MIAYIMKETFDYGIYIRVNHQIILHYYDIA